MLVITRKLGQKVMIGPNVVVTVVEVDAASGKVRLGVAAPPEVRILREELLAGGPPTPQPKPPWED